MHELGKWEVVWEEMRHLDCVKNRVFLQLELHGRTIGGLNVSSYWLYIIATPAMRPSRMEPNASPLLFSPHRTVERFRSSAIDCVRGKGSIPLQHLEEAAAVELNPLSTINQGSQLSKTTRS